MLRFRWLLMISLVCGLLTTIATAWGMSWFEVTAYSSRVVFVTADELPFHGVRMWPGVTCTKIELSVSNREHSQMPVGAPPYWSAAAQRPTDVSSQTLPDQRWEYAAGFPFRALTMYQVARWRPQPLNPEVPRLAVEETHSGLVLEGIGPKSAGARYDRYLPYSPIWRGLLANALIYGAMFFIPLVALTQSRRVRRVKSQRCAKCQYDLRSASSPRCPECGTPLPTKGRQRIDRWIGAVTGGLFAIEVGLLATIVVTVTLAFQTRWSGVLQSYWVEELPARWLLVRIDGTGGTVVRWQPDAQAAQFFTMLAQFEGSSTLTERQIDLQKRVRQSIVEEQQKSGTVDPSQRPFWAEHQPISFRDGEQSYATEVGAYGWPWRAFQYERRSHSSHEGRGLRGGIQIGFSGDPDTGMPATVIPAIPIWRGLIANTIVFAFMWIALAFFVRASWRGAKALRRRALTRRGTPARSPRTSP